MFAKEIDGFPQMLFAHKYPQNANKEIMAALLQRLTK